MIIGALIVGVLAWRIYDQYHKKSESATGTGTAAILGAVDPTLDQADPKQPIHRVLVPEDPAKYGMVVVPSHGDTPKTTEEWESFIRKSIEENHVLQSPEAKDNLDKVKVSQKEFDEDMTKLNTSIRKYEAMVNANPTDNEAKQRLNRLYKLKAVGNILKDNVINPS